MESLCQQIAAVHEQILVLTAQQGETEAFRKLVEIYERRLLYFIRRLSVTADGSLDVLQETWLTVFRRLPTLKSPAAFRVWLYRIARDKAVDALRRRRRQHGIMTELFETRAADSRQTDLEADNDFDADDARAIHHALGRLSDPHREVLSLRFLEGMPLEDISQVLGCSVGTVKSRLHHARRLLRQSLERKKDAQANSR